MKDEIKEIIENIREIIKSNRENEFNRIIYDCDSIEQLLDYITNLQEEIHKKEAMYDSLAVDYRLSQEENERLRKELELCKKNGEM